MRRLLLAALLLTLLTNCKRLDGDTLCEGTVVDRHTNTRVANATVGVYVAGSSGGGLGGGYRLKEEHQADASGNFAFQINDDSEELILRASTDQGHFTSFQEAPKLRGGRNNKKLILKTYAPAWIKINIIDQAPRDTVNIGLWGDLPSYGTGIINGGDRTVILPVEGHATARIHWEITPLYGNQTLGQQDIYCPGLDTVSIQVIY